VGVADEDAREAVEGDLVVGLRIRDRLALVGGLQVEVIGKLPVDRPRRRLDAEPRQQPLLDPGHQRSDEEPRLEPLLEVARALQLGMEPALLERLGIRDELVVLTAGDERVERSLGGEHAGLDRGVAALDPARVEIARLAADEGAAREHRLRQAENAACGDRARTVAEALAAFERLPDLGMGLPALEFLERAQERVLVVEADNEAELDLAVVEVVEERAAVGRRVERPAAGVDDEARLGLVGRDLPQLLDADAVALGVAAFVELVVRDQLAAEAAARA